MSKTTSNSITQRIIGAVVLLALIALIAVLLFQPSDKLPSTASKGQRPTTIAPDTPALPGNNQVPPIIILESTPGNEGNIMQGTANQGNNATQPNISIPENVLPDNQAPNINPPSVEVIDEAIWQQVEQATTQSRPPVPSNSRPIAQGFNQSVQAAAPTAPNRNNTQTQQKPSTKPNSTTNAAKKPETTSPPKLELISSSQANQNRVPAVQNNKSAQGKTNIKPAQSGWFVQLGAFSKTENAQKTYNQYKQLGYNVHIQKGNNIHRVQIGPYASKEAAEQIKTRTQNTREGIIPAVIRIP